jgi:hypothetical protein
MRLRHILAMCVGDIQDLQLATAGISTFIFLTDGSFLTTCARTLAASAARII